jgi:hypothetical protein
MKTGRNALIILPKSFHGIFRSHHGQHSLAKKSQSLTLTCMTRKGHTVAQLVEAHATSRKVAGSIPEEVIGFFELT